MGRKQHHTSISTSTTRVYRKRIFPNKISKDTEAEDALVTVRSENMGGVVRCFLRHPCVHRSIAFDAGYYVE